MTMIDYVEEEVASSIYYIRTSPELNREELSSEGSTYRIIRLIGNTQHLRVASQRLRPSVVDKSNIFTVTASDFRCNYCL